MKVLERNNKKQLHALGKLTSETGYSEKIDLLKKELNDWRN